MGVRGQTPLAMQPVFDDLVLRVRPFEGSCWPLAILRPSSSCPLPARPPRILLFGAPKRRRRHQLKLRSLHSGNFHIVGVGSTCSMMSMMEVRESGDLPVLSAVDVFVITTASYCTARSGLKFTGCAYERARSCEGQARTQWRHTLEELLPTMYRGASRLDLQLLLILMALILSST